jgi:hypothetical protein
MSRFPGRISGSSLPRRKRTGRPASANPGLPGGGQPILECHFLLRVPALLGRIYCEHLYNLRPLLCAEASTVLRHQVSNFREGICRMFFKELSLLVLELAEFFR